MPTPASPVADALCPACNARALRFTLGTATVRCAACPWEVHLFQAEATALLLAYGRGDTAARFALLRRLHERAPVVPAPPDQRLVQTRTLRGHKARIVPTAPETPRERLNRLADQAALAEMQFRKVGRVIEATSQQIGPDGVPVTIYHLTRAADSGGWACDCPYTGTDGCAHLAGYWAHLQDVATELATVTRTRLERQFGIAPDTDPATTQARGTAAISEMWGDRS